MPSKVGKRARKGKIGKRASSSSQHAEVVPKPLSHSTTDYSKFDQIVITDSDEESPHGMFAGPSFDDGLLTTDSCACPHCSARREAEGEDFAGRAASDSKGPHSSRSSAPAHPHGQPSGGFNFSKALGNAGKGRGAEGKSGLKHAHDPPVFTIEGTGGDHASLMAAIDQAASGAGLMRNSTQVITDPNAVSSTRQAMKQGYGPPGWDKQTYKTFIQKYLNDCDYSPMFVCDVLERFETSTQSGEPPESAVPRIFHERSIPVDSARLELASFQVSSNPPKGKEASSKASKKMQGSLSSRQRHLHPESKPQGGMAADPGAFKAALAKHGFQTINMRPATEADKAFMQTGVRQNGSASGGHGLAESYEALSSADESSDDDDDGKLLDLVDIKQYPVQFKPPGNTFQPPASAAPGRASNKAASAKPPAAKPPAAKPPAAKSPAAKPPAAQAPAAALPKAAKPSVKAQATTKPAGTAARQAAAASTPQRVDTISDDDSDDMPDLASASDSDSDNDEMPSLVDSEEQMPDLVDSDGVDGSDDDDLQRRPPPASPAVKPAAKPAAATAAKPAPKPAAASHPKQSKEGAGRGQAEPPVFQSGANSNPQRFDPLYKGSAEAVANASKGKQAPSGSAAKLTAAPVSASAEGEPIFRPVSRGPLAQYSTLLSSHTPSEDIDPDGLAPSSSTAARDSPAAATSFSFDRPSTGKATPKQPSSSTSAQPADHSYKGSGFMAEPTVGNIENIMRATGARTAAAAGEQARRAQMEGTQAFTSHYTEEETPQQRAAKQKAADAAMQKLLEEEEQEKAEAAARADKAKKEKQKSKKAKQKAKKKSQQEKDAKRSGSKAVQNPPPTRPSLNPPPESSASDSDEEEEEPFSLHDSRFGSLLADTTSATESAGSGGVQEGKLSDPPKNKDSLMRQLGGAYKHLPKMGGAGPSSEKSYSSQDTQSSSQQAGPVPVLKPGQSPLQWSNPRPQAQQPVPTSGAGSSLANGQQQQQQQAPFKVQSGLRPGAPLPTPAGVALPLPGTGPASQPVPADGPPTSGSAVQTTDPHLAQVFEACRQVVQEMEAARGAGERGRLQQAIKAAVAWLSQNASNPDVSDSSKQLRSKLLDAKAAMKQLASRGPAPAAAPPAAAISQAPVSLPGAAPLSQGPLAQAAPPLLPADLVSPATTSAPADTSRGPAPTALDTGRSSLVSHARPIAEPRQNSRPYQQLYRPSASEAAPASNMEPFRFFHGQQGSSSKDAHQPPYAPDGPALEPFRYPQRGPSGRGGPAGGRVLGQQSGSSGRGPYQHHMAGRGYGGSQPLPPPPPPQELYSAYRQRQAQPRPPLQPPGAMPVPPRLSVSSQAGSVPGSEHGSLDRSTLSGSEATSPVKTSQGQQQRYIQPTPFGMPEQPSFQDDYDDNDCVVCMDAVKCTIFVPCGHSLCCRTCAAKVTQTRARCPLCDIPTDGFCETQPSVSAQSSRQQQAAVAY